MGGRPLRQEAAVNVLATPSHRFTIINKAADWAVLLQPNLRGDRMFRRKFHYAPPEVVDRVYQLGPKQAREYLLRRDTATLAKQHRRAFTDYDPLETGQRGASRMVHGTAAETYPEAKAVVHLQHVQALPPLGTPRGAQGLQVPPLPHGGHQDPSVRLREDARPRTVPDRRTGAQAAYPLVQEAPRR